MHARFTIFINHLTASEAQFVACPGLGSDDGASRNNSLPASFNALAAAQMRQGSFPEVPIWEVTMASLILVHYQRLQWLI